MRKRRSTALAAALTGAFLFTACGIIKTYPQVNTARFHSDLSLTMISAESMDREYYDLDQLQTVILDAVNDYNEKNPDAISIDYYHVEGELATLILTYQNADHCTAFNEHGRSGAGGDCGGSHSGGSGRGGRGRNDRG